MIEPWQLLWSGAITSVVRSDSAAKIAIRPAWSEVPILLELDGVTELALWPPYDPDSEREPVTELAPLLPLVVEQVSARGDTVSIRTPAGTLRVKYASLAVGGLRDAARAYWGSCVVIGDLHPAIAAALARSALAMLLAAWRSERTSDLALAIEIVAPRSDLETLRRDVELAGWTPTWTYDDAARASRAVVWEAFTRRFAALRAEEPDPRIASVVEAALLVTGYAEHWFRADQVDHVILGRAAPTDPVQPSFADHALALLATHADAGTAARLGDLAARLDIEAACNEVEMSARLRELAIAMRARFPADRRLPDAVAMALRCREPRDQA